MEILLKVKGDITTNYSRTIDIDQEPCSQDTYHEPSIWADTGSLLKSP